MDYKINDNEIISEITKRIVTRFAPISIILFGSRAIGNANQDSDIDLLVIVKGELDIRALRLEIRRALRDTPISKDIFVMTEQDYILKKNIPGSLAYPADKEGVVLYAA